MTLIEVQENCDTTYRLYDYGRSRELHVEEALAALQSSNYVERSSPIELNINRTLLCGGPVFSVERWRGSGSHQLPIRPEALWAVPLAGTIVADGESLSAGETWLLEHGSHLSLSDEADLVLAYKGPVIAVSPNPL